MIKHIYYCFNILIKPPLLYLNVEFLLSGQLFAYNNSIHEQAKYNRTFAILDIIVLEDVSGVRFHLCDE
jgi:hypothetical protein